MSVATETNRDPLHAEAEERQSLVRALDALERAGKAISTHIDRFDDGLALLDRAALTAMADRLEVPPNQSSAQLRASVRSRLLGIKGRRR